MSLVPIGLKSTEKNVLTHYNHIFFIFLIVKCFKILPKTVDNLLFQSFLL